MLMKQGQISFHHCRTIHGSRPDSSSRVRLALAVHMQDHANHYARSTDARGNRLSHLNDFMCRKDSMRRSRLLRPRGLPPLVE